ncbi:MAG TPA: FMN-binding protein [Trebonia sp.]
MRRAVLALGGTVAGLAALFSYKTHVPAVTALSTPATPMKTATPSMTPTPTMKPPATKPAAMPKATKTTTAPAPPPTTTAPPPPPPKPSGTFTGPAVGTSYGPVQVQITVSDGKITQASGDDMGGSSIGENAIPQLNQEAVQAQSANIQAVSGATYTSQGYIQSLQQAIDSAHR